MMEGDLAQFRKPRGGQLMLIVKGIHAFDFERLDRPGNPPFTLAVTMSSCAA
jgi:hypothetical protein